MKILEILEVKELDAIAIYEIIELSRTKNISR